MSQNIWFFVILEYLQYTVSGKRCREDIKLSTTAHDDRKTLPKAAVFKKMDV